MVLLYWSKKMGWSGQTFWVEGSNTFMNAKLQQAGDGRKATWLDPLGATESHLPEYRDQEEKQAKRTEKQQNIQREEEEEELLPLRMAHHNYIIGLALVTEPTLWVIQKLHCIVYGIWGLFFFLNKNNPCCHPQYTTHPLHTPNLCQDCSTHVCVCVSKIKHLLK